MHVNMRRDPRRVVNETYYLSWQDGHGGGNGSGSGNGSVKSFEVQGIDLSASGIRVRSSHPIPAGTLLFIQCQGGTLAGYCIVRHCTPYRSGYGIGLEFNEETKATVSMPAQEEINYYEFLQISPNADIQAIHRIYRLLAARFHPDNPETGDVEKFVILQAAYDVLSDPQRRAEYDAALQGRKDGTLPIFELHDFVEGIEGEANRRLGILSLLYNKRRTSPYNPGISLLDLETRMGIPREYLDFTLWYLKSKEYITVADSSDFALTARGVDFVESNASKVPILDRLLQSGPRCATSFGSAADERRGGSSTVSYLMPPGDPTLPV